MKTRWHLRTRAVVYDGKRFLVVRKKGSSHSSLPGGHVETGESIPGALAREMLEETGRECVIKKYLGAIEGSWDENDTTQWEVTHFFNVEIPGITNDPDIISPEKELEFFWATPDEFEKINLLPVALRDLMAAWISGDKTIWWGSSIK